MFGWLHDVSNQHGVQAWNRMPGQRPSWVTKTAMGSPPLDLRVRLPLALEGLTFLVLAGLAVAYMAGNGAVRRAFGGIRCFRRPVGCAEDRAAHTHPQSLPQGEPPTIQ